ncbi:MAG: hypothetical protein U9Q05_03770 [Thermodesulfobacteriota bacterium]|nr:hypothetical protein [Thermodesulfobacteriota bacterium]
MHDTQILKQNLCRTKQACSKYHMLDKDNGPVTIEPVCFNLGIYLKAAIADGNPNPIKSSILGGISGKALFFSRPDIFGKRYHSHYFKMINAHHHQGNRDIIPSLL